jgi:hypothetical protein
MTEQGQYWFTTKEGERSECSIVAEPAGDTIGSLDGRTLGFCLVAANDYGGSESCGRFSEPKYLGDYADLSTAFAATAEQRQPQQY